MEKTIKKEHGALLAGWLTLIAIGNLFFAFNYIFALFIEFSNSGEFISKALPNMPIWTVYVFSAITILNVVFAFAIYIWKKWGFFGFCGSAVLAFIINLSIGLGLVSFASLLGLAILYILLRPKWNLLE